MKLVSLPHAIALSVLGLAALASASCAASCPDCKPVLNCAHDAGGSGSGGGPSHGTPSLLVSDTPCLSSTGANNCVGSAPAPYECMVYGTCDASTNMCLLKQPNGTACSAGSPRNCKTKPGGVQGVAYCLGTDQGVKSCNWPDNSGCVVCGGADQACCVGGCANGKTCKDVNGTPDLLNKAGSKCK